MEGIYYKDEANTLINHDRIVTESKHPMQYINVCDSNKKNH